MINKNDTSIKMVLILTAISVLAAVALSFVDSITKDKIAEARRLEFVKALEVVLPKFDNQPDKDAIALPDNTIYVAKLKGKEVGYAVKSFSKKGYGGIIDVLVGVSPEGKVIGIQVLKHSETPGLGDKITTEEFKNKFKDMDIKTKIAVKKDGGTIDQFSGATISPRAVCEAVATGLNYVVKNVLEKKQ